MKAPCFLSGREFHGDKMQDTRSDDLVDQSLTFTDRQGCPSVVNLAGADIEQRVSMAYRDVGLILNFTIRAYHLEDQQTSVLLKPNPGGAIPLRGEEALNVAQPAPLALDQTSEGRGEEKAAASSHEAQGM